MVREYKHYIREDIRELRDFFAKIILQSPKFLDTTGYFPHRNIDTVFFELNESLRHLQGKLGEEAYLKLRDMSDRARAYFEADPEDKADGRRKGCAIIHEMEDLVKQVARARRGRSQ